MQSLIDQLEQLALPHLRAGDLRWMYSTGKGQITGSGRDKRHTYRTGIQTPIGDIELSVWIKAAEYIVERDGLQEELEHLRPFALSFGASLFAKQMARANHLDMCISKIYRRPAWVSFIPYNKQYHPELIDHMPIVEVIMDCCKTVCAVPKAQIHKEIQTAHCPACGRWASFSRVERKKSE